MKQRLKNPRFWIVLLYVLIFVSPVLVAFVAIQLSAYSLQAIANALFDIEKVTASALQNFFREAGEWVEKDVKPKEDSNVT